LLAVEEVIQVKVLENIITEFELPIKNEVFIVFYIGIFCANKRNGLSKKKWTNI